MTWILASMTWVSWPGKWARHGSCVSSCLMCWQNSLGVTLSACEMSSTYLTKPRNAPSCCCSASSARVWSPRETFWELTCRRSAKPWRVPCKNIFYFPSSLPATAGTAYLLRSRDWAATMAPVQLAPEYCDWQRNSAHPDQQTSEATLFATDFYLEHAFFLLKTHRKSHTLN